MSQVFSFRLPKAAEQAILAQKIGDEAPGATARRLFLQFLGVPENSDDEQSASAGNFVDRRVQQIVEEKIAEVESRLIEQMEVMIRERLNSKPVDNVDAGIGGNGQFSEVKQMA